MKAVLMRVQRASVTIDERETRSIGRGFLILLAVTHDDTEAQAVKLADKLCSLRLFEDADGKINLTLDEVGGEIMIVDLNPWGGATDPLLLRSWDRDWSKPAGIVLMDPPTRISGDVNISF